MELQGINLMLCSSAQSDCQIEDSFSRDGGSNLEETEQEISQLSVGEETDGETDNSLLITCLPEVVLVEIMKYLSLSERYHLSVTCRLFYSLFSHPHLWRAAHISLVTQENYSDRGCHRWRLESVMHEKMAEIVRRFSHLFQHLSLEVYHHVQPFDEHCRKMLERLNEECRLESLCLRLGSLASNDEFVQRASAQSNNYNDLPLIVGLIKSAVRFKKLSIISWPLQARQLQDHDIFEALLSNDKITGLESLSIFYIDAQSEAWTERYPKLPSPEMTLRLVSHFRSLTHLALRSPMLNNEIIFELASKKRSRLCLLQILVIFCKDSASQEGFKIPDISSKAWNTLKKSSPELKVEYLAFTRLPREQMGLMLKPEVPLSSMTVLAYGRCYQDLIETITEHYKYSLEKFTSLCEAVNCDQALVNLVNSCTQLQHLSYHGIIHYKTIIKIAEIIQQRGLAISCFEFKEGNIRTSHDDDGRNDDVVVAREEDRNEYFLVRVRSYHEDGNQRRCVLDEMTDVVSRTLGYRWHPLG